jgi:hypothetical protein
MRTLKEQCVYLHQFASLEEARRLIGEFIARYNAEWLIERLGVTMMLGLTLKTEGRRGSQRRLGEGGRDLGLLRNGGPAAPRVGSENAEAQIAACSVSRKPGAVQPTALLPPDTGFRVLGEDAP